MLSSFQWEVSRLVFAEVRRGVWWPRDWDSICLGGRTPYAPDADKHTPRSERRESERCPTDEAPPEHPEGFITAPIGANISS